MRKFHLATLLQEGAYDRISLDIRQNPLGFGMDGSIDATSKESIVDSLQVLGITSGAVTLWGTGEPPREFLYEDDLAQALLFLMEHYDAADIGEFLNIGSGEDMKISEIAGVVRESVGFQGNTSYDVTKPDGVPRKALDVSSMFRLGWHPTVGIAQGIKKTYEWYTAASKDG
jgi:GDP-L-fucose synthase